MNTRTIKFLPSMMSAIQKETKTQTRRVIDNTFSNIGDITKCRVLVETVGRQQLQTFQFSGFGGARLSYKRCPWGLAGDKLTAVSEEDRPISLIIEDVSAQRLQDITEFDAVSEGVHPIPDPIVNFSALWDSIYGEGGWDSNPWVWAITFFRG